MSLSENPGNEPANYPGQVIYANASARVADALRTKLDGRGLQDTGIAAGEKSW